MLKSDIGELPAFFDKYIHQAKDLPLPDAFSLKLQFSNAELHNLELLQDHRYAPDKWTVKDVLQHVVDNERVQSYRALRIARGDSTPLPGYDENLFARHTSTATRSIKSILQEFAAVRQATILLFANLTPIDFQRTGVCNNITLSVLALGFIIVGHQEHHLRILRDRYLI